MKKRTVFINVFILFFLLITFNLGFADFQRIDEYYFNWIDFNLEDVRNDILDYQKIDWVDLSKSLTEKIAADDPKTQRFAMREIILYNYLSGDNLDVDETVFDLINIYETNENPKVRQLAVVTLHSIGNAWAMNYLRENIKYEEDENLKKFIAYCLCDYRNNTMVITHQEN
jgi:hypothetical protein